MKHLTLCYRSFLRVVTSPAAIPTPSKGCAQAPWKGLRQVRAGMLRSKNNFCSKHLTLLLIVGVIVFQLPSPLQAKIVTCPTPMMISAMSFDQMDSVSFEFCSPHQFILLVGAAQQMGLDTTIDNQIRADMTYSMIADELQRRSTREEFDPENPAITYLTEQLESQQYFLALTRPTDWEKLGHYLQEGRWRYVARRFVDRDYHYLLIALIAGLAAIVMGRRFYKQKQK